MSDDWIEDQSPCHRDELAREWDLRREQHYNSGYREGLDQGKEETLQQGFDSGFAQGCAAGYEWGLLQGATSTLRVFAGQIHGLDTQKAASVAKSLDLPKKQVMLTQCEAVMPPSQGPSATGEKHMGTQETSQITSEVFVSPFTPAQLEELMASARDILSDLGYQVNPQHSKAVSHRDLSTAGKIAS